MACVGRVRGVIGHCVEIGCFWRGEPASEAVFEGETEVEVVLPCVAWGIEDEVA